MALATTPARCAAECAVRLRPEHYAGFLARTRAALATLLPLPLGLSISTRAQGVAAIEVSCTRDCFLVKALLQVVLGTLAPLSVMWGMEEASRLDYAAMKGLVTALHRSGIALAVQNLALVVAATPVVMRVVELGLSAVGWRS
jgi:hypothetical protein